MWRRITSKTSAEGLVDEFLVLHEELPLVGAEERHVAGDAKAGVAAGEGAVLLGEPAASAYQSS